MGPVIIPSPKLPLAHSPPINQVSEWPVGIASELRQAHHTA